MKGMAISTQHIAGIHSMLLIPSAFSTNCHGRGIRMLGFRDPSGKGHPGSQHYWPLGLA